MRFRLESFTGIPDMLTELWQILAADVLEFNMLEIVPNRFIWIEVRRISWQAFEPETFSRSCSEKVFDRLTAMNGGPIPDNQQLAGKGSEQLFEKSNDRRAVEGSGLHSQIQLSRWRNGANHRVMIIAKFATQNRGLSFRCPCPNDAWQQIEGGFVNEENRTPFGYSSFFSSGHLFVTQSWMPVSLR